MLKLIHDAKKSKNLIVFVHGLQGNDATWINGDTGFYFPNSIGVDKDLKNKFSVSIFNYYSSIVTVPAIVKQGVGFIGKLFGKSQPKVEINLNVESISQLLFTYLETFSASFDSIILVCHSLGGLVGKSLVVNHAGSVVVNKIKLIISLAVPYNGSNLALIGHTVLKNIQLNNLTPLSENISKLTQAWIDNKDINPEIVYFQGKYDTIVPDTSSVGYDANVKNVKYCDDDHESISKPRSESSLVYVTVKQLLLDVDLKKKADEIIESVPDDSEDDIADEMFVVKLLIADVHYRLVSNAKQRFFDAERARKSIALLGVPKKELDDLYKRIEQIYVIEFGKVLSGTLKEGNDLLNSVNDKIRQEDLATLKSLERLNFTHKIGMIHQLANDIQQDIWWANEQSITTVEEFRNKKTEL